LHNQTVDFHIHPKQGINSSFAASGDYYNDDGLVLNTVGNGNHYYFDVKGNSSEVNFTVSITLVANASNYNTSANPNCTSVNKNDFVGAFEIYNA